MKTRLLPNRAAALALALSTGLHAQSNATPPALGLLRLGSTAKPNQAAPLVASKFSVDDLSTAGMAGANKGKRNNLDYLALDGGRNWSRPLRGNGKDVTFVSFQVLASQGTLIDIAGARLGVVVSPVQGNLQVMYDDPSTGTLQWKPLNFHIPTALYDGKPLSSLPTLTVCLTPSLSVWHIYNGSRLLADNLPLIEANKNNRTFTITAGTDGAWVVGLVLADDNPVYEDANGNAIDDRFEIAKNGSLQSQAATLPERQLLAKQWKDAQRAKPPPAFFVQRPLPDTTTSAPHP